jgi:methionine--tRNA ligase beta chain
MKQSKGDHDEIMRKVDELKSWKGKYKEITGTQFKGGSVLPQSSKKKQKEKKEDKQDSSSIPFVLPPQPPTKEEEELLTYSKSMIYTATKLVGLEKHGTPLFEANTIARYLFSQTKLKDTLFLKDMIGDTPATQAEVSAWMSMAAKVDDPNYAGDEFSDSVAMQLNSILETKSFLVGQTITLADIAVYVAVTLKKNTFNNKKLAVSTSRWLTTINEFIRANTNGNITALGNIPEGCPPCQPKPQPVASPKKRLDRLENKTSTAAPATTTTTPTDSSSSNQSMGNGAEEESSKSSKNDNQNSKNETENKDQQNKSNKKKKDKKEKKESSAPAAAAAAEEGEDVCKLDIRVGHILKAWEHPDSDKLWCESIDIGEDKPRSICSGLRPFYAEASDLVGRNVLVVANLKARKMAGFSSEGMVMCASSPDHDIVKFVEVPAEAKKGDRIIFEGLPVIPPATASQITKKKIAETVIFGGQLKTIENGECTFNGVNRMMIENCGPCTAPVPAGYTVA